jgi:predicted PolB exonuclease-like 3'-5' exonuclease
MAEILCFDIETIPQQTPLKPWQQEEYKKKVTTFLKRKFPDPASLGLPDYTADQYEEVRGITMATNYFLGEIVTIGLYKNDGKGQEGSTALVGTEKEILTKFWENLRGFKGTFVSFNGVAFDVPFIVKRSLYNGIKPTNNSFLDLKRFSRWPHFDVKTVIADFDNYATGTLATVCEFVGVESPKDGEIKADGVEKAFQEGKINLIAEYCVRDVIATYKCYLKVKDYTYEIQPKY